MYLFEYNPSMRVQYVSIQTMRHIKLGHLFTNKMTPNLAHKLFKDKKNMYNKTNVK